MVHITEALIAILQDTIRTGEGQFYAAWHKEMQVVKKYIADPSITGILNGLRSAGRSRRSIMKHKFPAWCCSRSLKMRYFTVLYRVMKPEES